MSAEIVDGKFACDQCGKRFKWKSEMAGKKAKCGCGAVLTVPQPTAIEDDEYELADAPEPAAPAPILTPPPVRDRALEYGMAKAAAAKKGKADDVTVHRFRDVYLPNALLVASGLALAGWSHHALHAGLGGTMFVSTVMGVATAIKTAILIGLALLIAPSLGISFGDFRSAVLKFAAIIIFTDVALLWIGEAMKAAEAVPANGRRVSIYVLLLPLGCSAALISFLSHYLFDMDSEETGMFALPMALVSWLLGLVLVPGVLAVVGGMAGAE